MPKCLLLWYCEMTFAQLTPDKITELQSKVQTLEPMNMELFNQKLKFINENYPITLPHWVILGGQIISSAFILMEITLTVWFCLKHKKSMNTFFKLGFLLARKILRDPKIIERLVQQTERFISSPTLPDPPPRPPSSITKCTTSASTSTAADHATEVPTTSKFLLQLYTPRHIVTL